MAFTAANRRWLRIQFGLSKIHQMKNTTIYKCHGAWSPLWALSDEPKFEIKSLNYENNLFMALDTSYCCIMTPPIPYPSPMIYFSEYHDPNCYGIDAVLKRAMIRERAIELFGSYEECGGSMARKHFVEQMEDGHGLIVRFHNGDCEITPIS